MTYQLPAAGLGNITAVQDDMIILLRTLDPDGSIRDLIKRTDAAWAEYHAKPFDFRRLLDDAPDISRVKYDGSTVSDAEYTAIETIVRSLATLDMVLNSGRLVG